MYEQLWGELRTPRSLCTYVAASRTQVQICIHDPFSPHNRPRGVSSLPLTNWKLPRDLGVGGLSGRVKSVVVSLAMLVKVPSMHAVTKSLEAHVTLVQIPTQT